VFAREVLLIQPGMPILITSGYWGADDRERAKQAGVTDFIFKPMEEGGPGSKVYRLLNGSSAFAACQ